MNLNKHIIACINLYGMVHIDKVIELFIHYNGVNDNNINFDPELLLENHIVFSKDFFVHEDIFDGTILSNFITETNGKPFCTLEFDEFKKYVNPKYIEETKEYSQLFKYLSSNNSTFLDVKSAINSISLRYNPPYDTQFLGRTIQYLMDLGFADESSIDEMNILVKHVTNHLNNFKLWNNRGYSPIELGKARHEKEKTPRNAPCPCGSGKKYKRCCMNKPVFDSDDLYYENVFEFSKEDSDQYIKKMKQFYHRIVPYMVLYNNPSYEDVLEFIKMLEQRFDDVRPKDMVGAIAAIVLRKNNEELYDNAIETIFRAIGIWGVRKNVLALSESIEEGFDTNKLMLEIETIAKSNTEIVKKINTNNPFKSIIRNQKQYVYSEEKFTHHLDIYIRAIELNLPNIDELQFLLIVSCPFLYPVLDDLIQEIDAPNHIIDAYKAYINAFEIVNKNELDTRKVDFTYYGDNKRYILAIDQLCILLKKNNKFKVAREYYEKGLKYDDHDRFNFKEGILICYLQLGDFDIFDEAIELLDDDSFYKPFMKLFITSMADGGYHKYYLKALEKSSRVLEIIINQAPIKKDELDFMEIEFLNDFYTFFSNKKFLSNDIIQLHNEK